MKTPPFRPEPGVRYHVEMSIMPAWAWELSGPDGILVKRFKSFEALQRFLARHKMEAAP